MQSTEPASTATDLNSQNKTKLKNMGTTPINHVKSLYAIQCYKFHFSKAIVRV